jgi:hypothetical protein
VVYIICSVTGRHNLDGISSSLIDSVNH